MDKKKQIEVNGFSICEGCALGTLKVLNEKQIPLPEFSIKASDVKSEITRFRRALSSSRQDLHKLQRDLAKEGSLEAVTIIDSHIQMLQDPMITTVVEEKIGDMLKNTESVFRSVVGEYEKQFHAMPDQFFRQRVQDVKDLSKRILHHLHPEQFLGISLTNDSILFCNELSPSLTVEAIQSKVQGLITLEGGHTSHAALIAKAKGVPFVSGIEIPAGLPNLVQVIIDGHQGKVIFSPSEETIQHYQKFIEQVKRQDSYEGNLCLEEENQILDSVRIYANIETLQQLEDVEQASASGIGLYRTEFLALDHEPEELTEELQAETYAAFVNRIHPKKIAFRAFDFGYDKWGDKFHRCQEANPALGMRGIRFLLENTSLFKTQVRALIRACDQKQLYLILPMIADVDEVLTAKEIIEAESHSMAHDFGIQAEIFLGAMLELPSALICIDHLIPHLDFFSIGSNDLMQYALGTDRCNRFVAERFGQIHPSVLRMIQTAVDAAKNENKPIEICGEVACSPLYIHLFYGMGLRCFSCAPRYIPQIRESLRLMDPVKAKELAEQALKAPSSSAVHELLIDSYQKNAVKPLEVS